MKHIIPIILLPFLFLACEQLPTDPNGNPTFGIEDKVQEEVWDHLFDGFEEELFTMSETGQVRAWVDNLKVKAQPGKEMPDIARLKKNETAKYLFQRTFAKSEVVLRGQTFSEPWLMVKVRDSLIGWVHGGGVNFIYEFPDLPVMGLDGGSDEVVDRSLDGSGEKPANSRKGKQDWLIIPGKRVGPITKNTTEADLIEMFGRANVVRREVRAPGKGKVSASVLMPGTPNQLSVAWKDDMHTKIAAIYFNQPNANWHTPEGLRVGMRLADVVKINESPISFHGFGWEYSGTVSSWKKGKLRPYEKNFYVMFSTFAPEEYQYVVENFQGEKVFSSNSPDTDKLHAVVHHIGIYLD